MISLSTEWPLPGTPCTPSPCRSRGSGARYPHALGSLARSRNWRWTIRRMAAAASRRCWHWKAGGCRRSRSRRSSATTAWALATTAGCARRLPTMDLLPPLLSQHLNLPERSPLDVDRPLCRRHPAPPLSTWGGEFSMTTDGDYWVTRDTSAGTGRTAPSKTARRGLSAPAAQASRCGSPGPGCRTRRDTSAGLPSARRGRLPTPRSSPPRGRPARAPASTVSAGRGHRRRGLRFRWTSRYAWLRWSWLLLLGEWIDWTIHPLP